MDKPITDAESMEKQSFVPAESTSITIVHFNGSDVVSDFVRAEEIDGRPENNTHAVRVWYSDEEYVDFHGGTITEVTP